MAASFLLGLFALIVTPREEEPQLDVTLATVTIPFPGATAKDVEQMVSVPAEQLLAQMPGVEHVMSVSKPDGALLTVQFEVGVERMSAMVRLREVLQSNRDRLPAGLGIGEPLVQSKSIDDVPILTLVLHSRNEDAGLVDLERIAHALEIELKQLEGTREIFTSGGPGHQILIDLDSGRLRSAGVTVGDIQQALQSANVALPAGNLVSGNRSIAVRAGSLIEDADEVRGLVVGRHDGRPVVLSEVATINDGAALPNRYVWHGIRSGATTEEHPAVVLQLTKNQGYDASRIVHAVEQKLDGLKNTLIPPTVEIAVTRNYGETGVEKTTRLTLKLVFVTIAVVVLVWLVLGWREAFLIGVAVLLTLALTLFASWGIGYTLNRVSLFALIFAVGILVDDAIVVAENIHRHMLIHPDRPIRDLIPRAVDEVGGPTILATFAVVAALVPLLNVGGMLGPYVAPITILSSIGMVLSLLIAFAVTPWMAAWTLKPNHREDRRSERLSGWIRRRMAPFLEDRHGRRNRRLLFGAAPVLIVLAVSFLAFQWVIFRTMPYENTMDFQVVVDMPPDTPAERTAALIRELGRYVAMVPEVRDYQGYVGLSAPIDFNGLGRQYYLRNGGEFGTLQVNLVGKHERKASGHAIAARVRAELHKIAKPYGASLRVAEPPPGPPSLASIVAEVYGPDDVERLRIAREVRKIFESTAGVMDVFDSSIADAEQIKVAIDRRKASTLGISQAEIASTLRTGLAGLDASYLYDAFKYPTPLRLQLPPADRSQIDELLQLPVRSADGGMVPISELVAISRGRVEQPIFHKDLRPVVYVGGDMGGRLDSPIYGMFPMRESVRAIKLPGGGVLDEHLFKEPDNTQNRFSLKWDGEWRLTYETFRDLGIGFAVALILIYLLIVGHFGSYLTPLVIMVPIPLTIIGVIPGHAITNSQMSASTAVGILALAGIIVRNSILLVDFINAELANGKPLREAVVAAPLARVKPILMTAVAAMLSGYFCLGDQFFDGLGTTLIFGVLASTLLTVIFIPLLHYHLHHRRLAS